MNRWIIDRISDFGERSFLADQYGSYTYSNLSSAVNSLSRQLLDEGISSGDVVILQADYSLYGIAALLALYALETISAPIATASNHEIEARVEQAQANWTVRVHANQSKLKIQKIDQTVEQNLLIKTLAEKREPGLILFSSGSTGKPKAMIHSMDRLLDQFSRKRKRRLSLLIFLLFDHIGGLNTLFNGLASGALIVVPVSRDPSIVAAAIEHYKVNLLPASPTFLNLLLMSGAADKHDLSSLRFITYGTEPMPESLLKRLKDTIPHSTLIQTFGTSETGISQTVSRSSNSTQIKIDDPNTEYKIVEGELWLRSKSQILGYLNHDMSRFTEDGWFKTGDLVEETNDGFITIAGRREDIINVGGEKVTPSEVESVLLEIPEVADCLVYGQTNAITGQNVAAEIVAIESTELPLLKRKIKQHCRKALSPYKVPARIVFRDKTTFSERYKKNRLRLN